MKKTHAETLAKLLPDSRLFAYKLLLEKDAKEARLRGGPLASED